MRPVDVKSRPYIAFEKKNNKFLNLRLDTIQEYQNIKRISKGYISNCSKAVFVITKVKNTLPWA